MVHLRDGTLYEGEWLKDKFIRDGRGVFMDENKNLIEGFWVANQLMTTQSHVRVTNSNMEVFEGDYERMMPNGFGKLSKYKENVKGYSYEGMWINGKRSGKGQEITSDKQLYVGQFRDD